jgi:plastocyanin
VVGRIEIQPLQLFGGGMEAFPAPLQLRHSVPSSNLFLALPTRPAGDLTIAFSSTELGFDPPQLVVKSSDGTAAEDSSIQASGDGRVLIGPVVVTGATLGVHPVLYTLSGECAAHYHTPTPQAASITVTPLGRIKLPARFAPLRQTIKSSMYPATVVPPTPFASVVSATARDVRVEGKPVILSISAKGLTFEPATLRLGGRTNTGYFTVKADEHDGEEELVTEVQYEISGPGALDYIPPENTLITVLPRGQLLWSAEMQPLGDGAKEMEAAHQASVAKLPRLQLFAGLPSQPVTLRLTAPSPTPLTINFRVSAETDGAEEAGEDGAATLQVITTTPQSVVLQPEQLEAHVTLLAASPAASEGMSHMILEACLEGVCATWFQLPTAMALHCSAAATVTLPAHHRIPPRWREGWEIKGRRLVLSELPEVGLTITLRAVLRGGDPSAAVEVAVVGDGMDEGVSVPRLNISPDVFSITPELIRNMQRKEQLRRITASSAAASETPDGEVVRAAGDCWLDEEGGLVFEFDMIGHDEANFDVHVLLGGPEATRFAPPPLAHLDIVGLDWLIPPIFPPMVRHEHTTGPYELTLSAPPRSPITVCLGGQGLTFEPSILHFEALSEDNANDGDELVVFSASFMMRGSVPWAQQVEYTLEGAASSQYRPLEPTQLHVAELAQVTLYPTSLPVLRCSIPSHPFQLLLSGPLPDLSAADTDFTITMVASTERRELSDEARTLALAAATTESNTDTDAVSSMHGSVVFSPPQLIFGPGGNSAAEDNEYSFRVDCPLPGKCYVHFVLSGSTAKDFRLPPPVMLAVTALGQVHAPVLKTSRLHVVSDPMRFTLSEPAPFHMQIMPEVRYDGECGDEKPKKDDNDDDDDSASSDEEPLPAAIFDPPRILVVKGSTESQMFTVKGELEGKHRVCFGMGFVKDLPPNFSSVAQITNAASFRYLKARSGIVDEPFAPIPETTLTVRPKGGFTLPEFPVLRHGIQSESVTVSISTSSGDDDLEETLQLVPSAEGLVFQPSFLRFFPGKTTAVMNVIGYAADATRTTTVAYSLKLMRGEDGSSTSSSSASANQLFQCPASHKVTVMALSGIKVNEIIFASRPFGQLSEPIEVTLDEASQNAGGVQVVPHCDEVVFDPETLHFEPGQTVTTMRIRGTVTGIHRVTYEVLGPDRANYRRPKQSTIAITALGFITVHPEIMEAPGLPGSSRPGSGKAASGTAVAGEPNAAADDLAASGAGVASGSSNPAVRSLTHQIIRHERTVTLQVQTSFSPFRGEVVLRPVITIAEGQEGEGEESNGVRFEPSSIIMKADETKKSKSYFVQLYGVKKGAFSVNFAVEGKGAADYHPMKQLTVTVRPLGEVQWAGGLCSRGFSHAVHENTEGGSLAVVRIGTASRRRFMCVTELPQEELVVTPVVLEKGEPSGIVFEPADLRFTSVDRWQQEWEDAQQAQAAKGKGKKKASISKDAKATNDVIQVTDMTEEALLLKMQEKVFDAWGFTLLGARTGSWAVKFVLSGTSAADYRTPRPTTAEFDQLKSIAAPDLAKIPMRTWVKTPKFRCTCGVGNEPKGTLLVEPESMPKGLAFEPPQVELGMDFRVVASRSGTFNVKYRLLGGDWDAGDYDFVKATIGVVVKPQATFKITTGNEVEEKGKMKSMAEDAQILPPLKRNQRSGIITVTASEVPRPGLSVTVRGLNCVVEALSSNYEGPLPNKQLEDMYVDAEWAAMVLEVNAERLRQDEKSSKRMSVMKRSVTSPNHAHGSLQQNNSVKGRKSFVAGAEGGSANSTPRSRKPSIMSPHPSLQKAKNSVSHTPTTQSRKSSVAVQSRKNGEQPSNSTSASRTNSIDASNEPPAPLNRQGSNLTVLQEGEDEEDEDGAGTGLGGLQTKLQLLAAQDPQMSPSTPRRKPTTTQGMGVRSATMRGSNFNQSVQSLRYF